MKYIAIALAGSISVAVLWVVLVTPPCQGDYRLEIGGEKYFLFTCVAPLVPNPMAQAPTCEAIIFIKELGWTGGHKTNFCKSKGYNAGNYNPPTNSYRDGGYCFKGEYAACKAIVDAR